MRKLFVAVGGIFLLILVALLAVSGPKTPRTPEQAAIEAAQKACNDDWRKCADNTMLANSLNPIYGHARAACRIAADAQAKYGTPVWPWIKFSSYRYGIDYITTGNAVLIENDAQFQNGFGAMVHSRVICTYDMNKDGGGEDLSGWGTQNVVSVVIVPK